MDPHGDDGDGMTSSSGFRSRGRGGGRGDDDGLGRLDPSMFAGVHLSSLPICEANAKYVRAQGEAFLKGARPPAGVSGVMEGAGDGGGEEEFVGRALRDTLSRGGMQAMGLRRFRKEHSNLALEKHHRLLGLPYAW